MLRSSMDTSTISIDADRGFPDDHHFMDPKHTSQLIESFFNFNHINWWKSPPESPDASPIEN